jgi:general secretion pathway protein G
MERGPIQAPFSLAAARHLIPLDLPPQGSPDYPGRQHDDPRRHGDAAAGRARLIMSSRSDDRESGFTIIELLVVVVIIGIVASIALVSLFNALDKAKQRASMADMRTISKAIETYMVDNNVPPSDAGGIASLVTVLTPYHSSVLPVNDHWQHSYNYTSDRFGNYTIESYGKDGTDGADVSLGSRFDFDLDIVLANGVFVAAPE